MFLAEVQFLHLLLHSISCLLLWLLLHRLGWLDLLDHSRLHRLLGSYGLLLLRHERCELLSSLLQLHLLLLGQLALRALEDVLEVLAQRLKHLQAICADHLLLSL